MFIGSTIGRYPVQGNGLDTEHFACAAKNSVCFCSNISYSCGIIRVVQVMQVLGRRNFYCGVIGIIDGFLGRAVRRIRTIDTLGTVRTIVALDGIEMGGRILK